MFVIFRSIIAFIIQICPDLSCIGISSSSLLLFFFHCRVTDGKYDPAMLPLLEYFKKVEVNEDYVRWLQSTAGQSVAASARYSAFDIKDDILVSY